MKVGGGKNYKLRHIGKAKLLWEGRLSISTKWSDEDLQIANAHINGSNDHVVGAIPDGMEVLSELMERELNIFLSDEDATFTAEKEL